MVVSPDTNGICPPQLVGKVFNSAKDLHKAISSGSNASSSDNSTAALLFATYNMEAISDPAFSSWEFTKARLCSAGLDASTTTGPYVVWIHYNPNQSHNIVTATVEWYSDVIETIEATAGHKRNHDDVQWALIEGDHSNIGGNDPIPPVLIGVPQILLDIEEENFRWNPSLTANDDNDDKDDDDDDNDNEGDGSSADGGIDNDLLPQPKSQTTRIGLPASLLQKAIRRGSGLCSAVPLFEACMDLIHPSKANPGSTLAFLKTVWSCMIVDSFPFKSSVDCLGLDGFLLLSLIAKADPTWMMPSALRRLAIAGALRTAKSSLSQQWVGFVKRRDDWHKLECFNSAAAAAATTAVATTVDEGKKDQATLLRNLLRVAQVVAGGKMAFGRWNKYTGEASAAAVLSYLNKDEWKGSFLPLPPPAEPEEKAMINIWETGALPQIPLDLRMTHLDEECRLASIEPNVMPQTLVLVQAFLARPPISWKKHGMQSLAKQVRKLNSEANPRYRERMQLARLQTWGKDKAAESTGLASAESNLKVVPQQEYKSYREVVTTTGTLSQGEMEVVECYESIQRWQLERSQNITLKDAPVARVSCGPTNRIKAGPPLTPHDGRIAFLLAFASAVEVEACGEVVSAMFCGDPAEPLLIQRIGRARKEGKELATGGGSTSGATAVPSLGYVQKSRSAEEAKIFDAAQLAVAKYWKDGLTSALPEPAVGWQWEVGDIIGNGWDEVQAPVERTAQFCAKTKTWSFAIGGISVAAFDARKIISPCSLDLDDDYHSPVQLMDGSDRSRFLRVALYVVQYPPLSSSNGLSAPSLPHGKTVLESLLELHNLAKVERATNPSEAIVYDWMPLARSSLLPARTWRDALLAIRTRDSDHVVLGKGVKSDGTGAPRDMTEGKK